MFDNNVVYPVTYIGGHPFLFSNYRHKPEEIPDGFVSYEVADAEGEGCFVRIKKHVSVNFWGTIIGKEELELDHNGQYLPLFGSDEYEGTYHEYLTIHEYIAKEFPEREMAEAQQVIDAENAVFARHKYKLYVTLYPLVKPQDTVKAIVNACAQDMHLKLQSISKKEDGYYVIFAADVVNNIRLAEFEDYLVEAVATCGNILGDFDFKPILIR